MKRIMLLACLLILPVSAMGASDKIDPATYICAELVASNVSGEPPIFEGLQLDGYASAKSGATGADATTLQAMLIEVSDSCAAKPTEKALEHWQAARKNHPLPDSLSWRADKTTCADYYANPDDGSGFIIWADGYLRGKTGKAASVLSSQEIFDHFLAECKASPDKLVIEVIGANAK